MWLYRNYRRSVHLFAISCLILALLLMLIPVEGQAAHAQQRNTQHIHASGLSLQVNAGFGTHYRNGNWVPVQITLHNNGPDFTGTLSLSAVPSQSSTQNSPDTLADYRTPVSLANGAQKQVSMVLPLYDNSQSAVVKLQDSSGNVVGTQTAQLNPLLPGDVLIGVLSDQSVGFGSLNTLTPPTPNSSLALAFLQANTMPTMATLLKNFDALVLDNFTTSNLNTAQLHALDTWVDQGGTLIAVGGPEWKRTLSPLPGGLLPVNVNSTATVPAGTSLLPPGAPRSAHLGQASVPPGLSSPLPISVAALLAIAPQDIAHTSDVVLSSGSTPLLVQARRGQGMVIYLAFDPTLAPLIGWPGVGALWKGLVMRGLGERILTLDTSLSSGTSFSGQEQPLLAFRMSSLLASLLPHTLPSAWWPVAVLLIGYILILGPLRYFVLLIFRRDAPTARPGRGRRYGISRDWSWRIVLICIVLFSPLSFGLALRQNGTSVLSNSFSIAQLGQDGAPASITTYQGVFVPKEGDFALHMPDDELVQPSPDNLSAFQYGVSDLTERAASSVTMGSAGADIHLRGVKLWTMHPILSQQDRQITSNTAGLVSHLSLQQGMLVGTVTNTLGHDLSDAFLLLPNNAFRLGYMAQKTTKAVKFKLSSAAPSQRGTLADLIAANTNSPGYTEFPPVPQTTWQRHLLLLYALDEEGYHSISSICGSACNPSVPIVPVPPFLSNLFPALNNTLTPPYTISTVPSGGWPYITNRESDPLLLAGAPVTFIGWVNSALDSTAHETANAINPAGVHETLIQAPLSLDFAHPSDLPPGLITGHLIDARGNVLLPSPGVYTILNGSMTFEYTLPLNPHQGIAGLTITEPIDPLSVITINIDSPLGLYNWHTARWDTISLSNATFTTQNVQAYVGPGEHVLIQLASPNNASFPPTFSKPSINLQGVVS